MIPKDDENTEKWLEYMNNALKHLLKAFEINPSASVCFYIGLVYFALK